MKLCWLAVLGCCVFVTGHPVADSTQDTLVITKDDTSTEAAPTTETEVVTDEPVLPIKLTEMEVTSTVSLRYAHTAVVARVKNPAKRAQEANFRVLLPETAFISGFVMTLDGKSYKAYVKEKEEAKQIYDQAVSQGFGAAHVTAKARDSNQFVVSVNVEPSTSAIFNLTYEELLVRRNGVYNHAINLHPGALVPKLSVTVNIREEQKITELRVPEVRTGNEIDATKDDAQNSKAVITRGHDDREATITFTPDLDEQKRLMEIYADKSKESAASTQNSWYYHQPEEDKNKNEGVLGQFIVQYDVDRPKDGEILVNDGYFVHFFAPKSLPPLRKYVVFVLDTSGSMMGHKIVQLREAMQAILSDLNPGDYFSIVEFESAVTVHALKEADQEPPRRSYYYSDYDKKPALVPPSPATSENIEKAKVIVSRLDAAGGTNIASALDVAVNLIHKRTEWGKKAPAPKAIETESSTPVSTDAPTTLATTEPTIDPKDAELYEVERMKTLEPIIIFLTDGDPTVGETNPTTIMNRLTEKNYGEDKASIFSLAFGEDADRKFLRKLSLRNDGFMRHIYEAADAALQLQDFYRQVSSPLLADVKFTYPANQVKEDTVTKNKFRTFYAGSEVIVAGQLLPDTVEITPQVLGFCGVEDGFGKKRYEKLPKAPVPVKRQGYLPLERLWSYLTIKQLLDQKDASDEAEDVDKDNSPKKKALALALKYEFVTSLTSLVVVKPNATNAVNAESVDKPDNSGVVLAHSFASSPGLPGAPGAFGGVALSSFPSYSGLNSPAAPVYSSQSLSLDSLVQAEAEDYDYALQEGQHALLMGAPVSYPISNYNRVASSSYGMRRRFYSSSHLLPAPQLQPLSFMNSPQGGNIFSDIRGDAVADNMDYNVLIDTAYTAPALEVATTRRPNSTPLVGPPAISALDRYRLEEYRWTEPLLNVTADALVLPVNGTDVFLKLVTTLDSPKAASGDASCPIALDGHAGSCVYLRRCEAAKQITVDQYRSTYCSVDGYAGICCIVEQPANSSTVI